MLSGSWQASPYLSQRLRRRCYSVPPDKQMPRTCICHFKTLTPAWLGFALRQSMETLLRHYDLQSLQRRGNRAEPPLIADAASTVRFDQNGS